MLSLSLISNDRALVRKLRTLLSKKGLELSVYPSMNGFNAIRENILYHFCILDTATVTPVAESLQWLKKQNCQIILLLRDGVEFQFDSGLLSFFDYHFKYPGELDHLAEILDFYLMRGIIQDSSGRSRFIPWEKLLNAIQDGICIINRSLEIVSANETISRWFHRHRRIIGEKCYQLYKSASFPCEGCPTREVFLKGETRKEVVSFTTDDGKLRWVELYSYPILGPDGEVEFVLEHRRDVTEQMIIREALEASEHLFTTAFHINPDPISINRFPDGEYLDVNESFTRVTGYSHDEVIGRTPHDLGLWVDEKDRFHYYREIDCTGELRNYHARFRMKSGEIRDGLLSAKSFFIEGERHVITIINDITEQKKAARILEENEKFMEAVLDSILDGIMVLNPDLRILRVNRTIEEWFSDKGIKLGEKCFQVLHNRKEPCEFCPVLRTIETKSLDCQVCSFVIEDDEKWFERNSYPVFDDKGKITAVIEYIRDVTDRRRTEAALKESEAKYRRLLENLADGQVVIQDGRIVFCNEAFEKMIGYSRGELLGRPFEKFIAEDYALLARERYEKRMAGEQVPSQYELELIHRDGSSVFVEISAMKIRFNKRAADSVVIRDVSERYRLERELVHHREAIFFQRMEALAVSGRLAAGVAHEINNPLQGIKGQLRLLEEELPDKIRKSRSMYLIKSGLDRIAIIVRSLLDLYREHEETREYSSLGEVLSNLQKLLQTPLQSQGVEIRTHLSPPDIKIPLARERLNQVLMNLILNARDAMPEGGTIRVSARKVVDGVFIKVKDEGVGIPGENLGKIFSPFFTTKGPKGTGLGLSVTHSLIAAVGGKIEVESKPGKGSCFTIWIPHRIPPKNHDNY